MKLKLNLEKKVKNNLMNVDYLVFLILKQVKNMKQIKSNNKKSFVHFITLNYLYLPIQILIDFFQKTKELFVDLKKNKELR